MERDNTNRGAIWPNKRKEQDTHPDFTGSLNVDGVEFWVNAWKRKEGDASNKPSLSFTVRPKDDKGAAAPPRKPAAASTPVDLDDEIPF